MRGCQEQQNRASMVGGQANKTVRFNGHVFERIRVLGKGSFGTAILYRRQLDSALVVLKEIDLLELKGDTDKLTAIQEAQIMSKLSHRNIIKYHNAYTTGAKLVIEMEYARLGTLQTYLSYQSRPLEEQEIFQIFRQILFGLDYLHSKSIVHLDLKMANIFVTSDGGVKIGDFGIAKFVRPATSSSHSEQQPNLANTIRPDSRRRTPASVKDEKIRKQQNDHYQLGTLAFSSPERCLGEATDAKSDIWSLGCVLYELITLKPLFSSESLAELVLSIIRVQYEPIQRPDIKPAMKQLLERMISRHPSDRPSAGELISSTDQLLLQLEASRSLLTKSTMRGPHLPVEHLKVLESHAKQKLQGFMPAAGLAESGLSQHPLNYKHSLLYQVRLDSHDIQVERVNLPQSKRIKEIVKGRSHYLALTYDNIVYGWGTKHHGQLGACNVVKLAQGQEHRQPRSPSSVSSKQYKFSTRSARNSLTARDLQLLSPSLSAKVSVGRGGQGSARAANAGQPNSMTQPPSLSSSTQTILVQNNNNNNNNNHHSGSSASLMASDQNRRAYRQQFRMLSKARPASRPIVISELNKRKITRVAAGNNFSVFLSKTGIVMTCGDGSKGCLGRGTLANSFTPCMVDGLLNMDVASIAAGPEHVIAICSNGQAFAWGNSREGRLGVKPAAGDGNHGRYGVFVVRPQLIHFNGMGSSQPKQGMPLTKDEVFITSAYCGDDCTVFIDSNNSCWACGHNRSNRLGLDNRRRFKRTVLVETIWTPVRIPALANERVVSCSIGREHASYLTSDGRMLVLGQDIDHSYRLRMSLSSGNKQAPLGCAGKGITIDDAKRRNAMFESTTGHESLVEFLLATNQLGGFKLSNGTSTSCKAKNSKSNRAAIKQVELFLKRSRASKRMPFDCVVGMSCTSRFSLALTSDNRVYFWGTRTHEMDQYGQTIAALNAAKPAPYLESPGQNSPDDLGPQLVANCSDECFVKIGATNSSLMSTVEHLGSDQPIILARNPKLAAKSLRDLWILDYTPSPLPEQQFNPSISSAYSLWTSASSSCSSLDFCSSQPEHSSCSSVSSSTLQNGAGPMTNPENNSCYRHWQAKCALAGLRHDAILEPQPIVSLYVPAMFNHNGCALQLVNLFCFDEDRFFLVLDTTVKLQQAVSFATNPPVATNARVSDSSSRKRSYSFKSLQSKTRSVLEPQQNYAAPSHRQPCAKAKLNMVRELRSGGSRSQEHSAKQDSADDDNPEHGETRASFQFRLDLRPDESRDFKLDGEARGASNIAIEPDAEIYERQEHAAADLAVDDATDYQIVLKDAEELERRDELELNNQQLSPVSYNCLSLEEPRSMSTFAPGFQGNNIAIVCSGSPQDNDCESLRRLSFERSQQSWHFDHPPKSFDANAHLIPEQNGNKRDKMRRRRRRTETHSESTVTTGGCEDDTSSMPTWVKNEYIQQLCESPSANKSPLDQNGRNLSSEGEETFCGSMTTEASGGSVSSMKVVNLNSNIGGDIEENQQQADLLTSAESSSSSEGCWNESTRRVSSPAAKSFCRKGSIASYRRMSRSQPSLKTLQSNQVLHSPDSRTNEIWARQPSIVSSADEPQVYTADQSTPSSSPSEISALSGENIFERNSNETCKNSEERSVRQRASILSCDEDEYRNPSHMTQDCIIATRTHEHNATLSRGFVRRKNLRVRSNSLADKNENHFLLTNSANIDGQMIDLGAQDDVGSLKLNTSHTLKKSTLSRSACFSANLEAQRGRLQTDHENAGFLKITRSRSSLSSLRKSFVRIFC